MTLKLKIEVLKIFSLELDFSSTDKMKKEEKDAKTSDGAPDSKPK